MLHDEAEIVISSGKGGDGCCSFRRESCVPEGGPDGGDGGRGGDVVLVASVHLNTLMPFTRRHHWKAQSGRQGGARNCTGAGGKDLRIEVPCGTIVRHAQTKELIADMTVPGEELVIARGGKGGLGNINFKTSTNRTPRKVTPGQAGVTLPLTLELKLIAQVGLLGFPNAGKSTFLRKISSARPKVAPYPFTTLEPHLGVVERGTRILVVADIPGLLEGASKGLGLGHRFLRHVERCSYLLHLVDGSEGDASDIERRITILSGELAAYSPKLAAIKQIIAINKCDTRQDLPEVIGALETSLGHKVWCISGVSGEGVEALVAHLLNVAGKE